MITGATGYVAGWIVKRLLDDGFTVHAPVRQPENREKLKYLNALAESAPGGIRYFEANLMRRGSYAAAIADCQLVLHTASPFVTRVDDPQTELVDPALQGTRNVLEQVNATPGVRRVVLTSSCAAIYGDNIDITRAPGGILTEEIWNTSSSLEHNPYSYSKTLAEREAWKLAGAQERWDLVVVNPSLVMGPGINPRATSGSFHLIRQLGDGAMKWGAPSWGLGVVDVRDLAEAHWAAALRPDAAGRHIVSAHDTDFLSLARPLIENYGAAWPFPKRRIPKYLLWLAGPLINDSLTRKTIRRNVNYPFRADNGKSIRAVGMRYRGLDQSMVDMFQQMIDEGTV